MVKGELRAHKNSISSVILIPLQQLKVYMGLKFPGISHADYLLIPELGTLAAL